MQRRDFLKTVSLGTGLIVGSQMELLAYNPKEFQKDLFISKDELQMFLALQNRLSAILKYVGFGNFNIISFDEALYIARNVATIGAFSKEEKEYMEAIFYTNPVKFGFYGSKTCEKITDTISKKDIYKVPHSGHYVFKGKPLELYNKIIEDIGDTIILTSGVRSVVKQFSLYLNKILSVDYNISLASKSIAPPAYSYHSISDFDVGKKGFGAKNFSNEFSKTQEFQLMIELGYIELRYKIGNEDGVIYEPWHIKV